MTLQTILHYVCMVKLQRILLPKQYILRSVAVMTRSTPSSPRRAPASTCRGASSSTWSRRWSMRSARVLTVSCSTRNSWSPVRRMLPTTSPVVLPKLFYFYRCFLLVPTRFCTKLSSMQWKEYRFREWSIQICRVVVRRCFVSRCDLVGGGFLFWSETCSLNWTLNWQQLLAIFALS